MNISWGKNGVYIMDRFWYFYLIKQKEGRYLMEEMTDDKMSQGIIVCLELENPKKCFSYFDSYVSLYKYIISLPDDYRCMYEVINGMQKIHYDIDISENQVPKNRDIKEFGDSIIEQLLKNIRSRIKSMKPEFDIEKNLLVFSSHGINSKGKNKYSVHIVVDGICFTDNRNTKAFYDLTMYNISYKKLIDDSVYKTNQQFRLVGNHKFNDPRYKEPSNHEIPEDDYEAKLYFARTLVGWTHCCEILPNLIKSNKGTLYNNEKLNDIPENVAEEAVEKLKAHYEEFPYKMTKIDGNKISLRRLFPSVCPVCPNTLTVEPHMNDNAFIKIENDNIIFTCWRNMGKKLHLGKISCESKAEIIAIEEEVDDTVGCLMIGDIVIDKEGNRVEKELSEEDEENSKESAEEPEGPDSDTEPVKESVKKNILSEMKAMRKRQKKKKELEKEKLEEKKNSKSNSVKGPKVRRERIIY